MNRLLRLKDIAPRGIAPLLLLTGLLLAGCDDPSDVGIGLVEQQAGEPRVETIPASSMTLADQFDVTGGTPLGGAIYSVAGTVSDPVLGSVTATGYVDYLPVSNPSSDFRDGTLNQVRLTLSVGYVYGDTTSNAAFEVYDVSEAWLATGRRADTTLAVGPLVSSFTVPAGADEVSIFLPDSWVTGNASRIQDSDFAEVFHGFEIRPIAGNVVLGFEVPNSEMVAATAEGDTARYQISQRLSRISRSGTNVPAGTILLQDGHRSVATLTFPFRTEPLDNSAVHRFSIRLAMADEVAPAPAGFVRPPVGRVGLRAVAVDDAVQLTLSNIEVTGDEIVFDNDVIADVVQAAVQGGSNLDRFEVFIPPATAGIGFFLLRSADSGPEGARALATITPLD